MKQSTQRTLALVLCALCVVCLVFIAACNKPGDVTPGETTLERIEIAKQPNKTEYNVGEKFSRSGMVVKAYYSDGTSKNIMGYTVSKTDALTVDDKEIVITYQEKTAVVKITVTEKEIERELDITSTETKTYRVEAEDAWLASEAAGKDKTQYLEYHSETQGNPNTSGGVSLGNLNYSDNPNNIIMVRIWSEVEATVSVNICLGAPEQPLDFDANTTTEWNDKTVTTGFMVAHSVSPQHYWYDWNEYTIEGLKLNKGLNKLAIHMDNFMPNVDYFDIVVNPEARELTDVKIQNFPKISYTEGDVFDPSNMVVIATYSNGHSYGVTGFTYDKTAALTPADTEVTISFGGLTATLRIKVKSLSNPYPGQTDVNIDETIKVEAEDCDVVNRDGEEVNIASLTEVHNNTTGNPDTSNGMSIGKMNNSQNTVKLIFTALADGTVTIRLRVAHYVRYVFDENTSTTINGEAIATGIVVNRDENTPYPWFDWHTYEIANVPVREGVNVFAVKLLEEKESVNYDYFEVVFSAKKEPTPEPIEMPDDVRIEAETCDIYDPSGNKLNTADYTEQHSATEGNPTTSGGISVGKMGNSGNTLLLRYNSTVTATVRLLVRMSVTDAYVFDDNVVTKVNGVVVKTGLNLFRTADSKYVWFDWHVYEIANVQLVKGDNEIRFELTGGASPNYDYFEIVFPKTEFETIKVEAEDCSVYKPDGTLTDTNLYVENHSDTENNPNTSGGRSIGIWMNQSQFTITVRIHSDVAGKVVVKMCAAKSSPYIVDDNTVIKWNDNKVTTGLTIQNADGAQYVWHDWHVYTLGEFELKEGINELTITLNEGAEAINLDYFEFVAA